MKHKSLAILILQLLLLFLIPSEGTAESLRNLGLYGMTSNPELFPLPEGAAFVKPYDSYGYYQSTGYCFVPALSSWIHPTYAGGSIERVQAITYDDTAKISYAAVEDSNHELHLASWQSPCTFMRVSDLNTYSVSSIVAQGGVILIAAYSGVLRSTDGGISFQEILIDPAKWNRGVSAFYSSGQNDNVFYATTTEGNSDTELYRSTDAGLTWTCIRTGHFSVFMDGSTHFIFLFNNDTDYSDGKSPENERSKDQGQTWETLPEIPGGGSFSRAGARLYSGTFGNLYASTDNGDTWMETSLPVGPPLVALNESSILGNDGQGISLSDDGGSTWRDVSTGLENVSAGPVAMEPGNGRLYSVSGNSLYMSLNPFSPRPEWSKVGSDSTGAGSMYVTPAKSLLLSRYENLYRSANEGRTLRKTYSIKYSYVFSGDFVSIARKRVGALIRSSSSTGRGKSFLLESSNDGLTWKKIAAPGNASSLHASNGKFLMVAVDLDSKVSDVYWYQGNRWKHLLKQSGTLIVGSDGGKRVFAVDAGEYGGSVYFSGDGGLHWKKRKRIPFSCTADQIAVNPARRDELYVACDGYLLHSASAGRSWEEIVELPATAGGMLVRNGKLIVATEVGLYMLE